ncbi:MAG TPA: hypothetical protein VJ872_17550 [Nocardioides sp.]|nr:hypothetical protein [Nocardioides sp.]
MSEATEPAAATQVTVAGRRTPMVLSVARALREGLERGGQLPADTSPRTVLLRSAVDAQQAFLTFADGGVTVAADPAGDADVTWEVRWSNPTPAEAGDDPFAQRVAGLLAGGSGDWRQAAERFWSRAGALPGLPEGLQVFCADDEGEAVVGAPGPDGQGVLGTAAALTSFFDGRATMLEVLEGGEFGINISFPVLSALLGANLKVVCGEL